jgi:hypothetical protein
MKRFRRSISSLRPPLRVWSLALLLTIGSLAVSGGGPPAWWQQRGVLNSHPADDYAAANQGQLKNLAGKAYEEFSNRLANIPGGIGNMDEPDGTGWRIFQLVVSFSVPTAQTDDFAAVNLGQLKAVAKPFYDRLIEIGFTDKYPWTSSSKPADDYAMANLGQLKNVFSFDLVGAGNEGGPTDVWKLYYFGTRNVNLEADDDHDGLSNGQEFWANSNPKTADSDNDGIPDGWEWNHNLHPNDATDAVLPYAGGGNLTNLLAYQRELPGVSNFQLPLGRLSHHFKLHYWDNLDGTEHVAELYSRLVTPAGQMDATNHYVFATGSYGKLSFAVNSLRYSHWFVSDDTTGETSPPDVFDLRPDPWNTQGGPERQFFIVPVERAAHSFALVQENSAYLAEASGFSFRDVAGREGTAVSVWTTYDSSLDFYLLDLSAQQRSPNGETFLLSSTWTNDGREIPMVSLRLYLPAGEIGHRFTLRSRAPSGPVIVSEVQASEVVLDTVILDGDVEIPAGSAMIDTTIGRGMEFWLKRKADDFPSAHFSVSDQEVAAFNLLNVFPDQALRTHPLEERIFRIDNRRLFTFSPPVPRVEPHAFTVWMDDGYHTSFSADNNNYTPDLLPGYDDQGHELPASSFKAWIDPSRNWWLRDDTTGTVFPVGQTDVRNPYHEAPPDPLNTRFTLRLGAYWLNGYRLVVKGSSWSLPVPPGWFSTQPETVTNSTTGVTYTLNVATLALENSLPYQSGTYTLEASVLGSNRPEDVAVTSIAPGNNDLRQWFPTGKQDAVFSISASRSGHTFVVRHINGDEFPLTLSGSGGDYSFASPQSAWLNHYYWLGATAQPWTFMDWKLVDKTTGETAPDKYSNIGWIWVTLPKNLSAQLSAQNAVVLTWEPCQNIDYGAYRVERRDFGANTSGVWEFLPDSVSLTTPTFTDATALPGHIYQYRVMFQFGDRNSATTNVVGAAIRGGIVGTGGTTTGGGGAEGTGTYDPSTVDTDHDGLTDAEELANGTNPMKTDSDGDGVPDGEDAVGNNPHLKFKRRPLAHFGVIELGGTGFTEVNDLAQVLQPNGGVWSKGEFVPVPGVRAINNAGYVTGNRGVLYLKRLGAVPPAEAILAPISIAPPATYTETGVTTDVFLLHDPVSIGALGVVRGLAKRISTREVQRTDEEWCYPPTETETKKRWAIWKGGSDLAPEEDWTASGFDSFINGRYEYYRLRDTSVVFGTQDEQEADRQGIDIRVFNPDLPFETKERWVIAKADKLTRRLNHTGRGLTSDWGSPLNPNGITFNYEYTGGTEYTRSDLPGCARSILIRRPMLRRHITGTVLWTIDGLDNHLATTVDTYDENLEERKLPLYVAVVNAMEEPVAAGRRAGVASLWGHGNETEAVALVDAPDSGIPLSGTVEKLNNLGQAIISGNGTYSYWQNNRAYNLKELCGWTADRGDFGTPIHIADNAGFILVGTRNPDGSVSGKRLLLPVEMMVDGNRDTKMAFDDAATHDRDNTTAQKPYRFWLNNDHDEERTVDGSDREQDDYNESPDFNNQGMLCERDLEDWSRLWINFKGLVGLIKTSGVTLDLAWKPTDGGTAWPASDGNPGIKVMLHDTPAGAGATEPTYLTEKSKASAQAHGVWGGVIRPVSKSGGYTLTNDFLQFVTEEKPYLYLLFEGWTAGKGQLVLNIKKDGQKIGEYPPVYLELKDVKEMYERYTVGDVQEDNTSLLSSIDYKNWPANHAEPLPLNKPFADPPPDETKDYILWVHGWNMSPLDKDCYADTAFKRLFWQGYKGRFGTFRWPTFYFTGDYPPRAHYDASEQRAWNSSLGLLGLLNDLNRGQFSGKVRLLAHSMGNVVAGEALRRAQSGQVVHTYVASQAAVPADCYDSSVPRMPFRTVGDIPHAQWLWIVGAAGGLAQLISLGPDTPDVYSHYFTASAVSYMHPNYMNGKAGRYFNYHNRSDFALEWPNWQLDEQLKPDLDYGYERGFESDSSYDHFMRLLTHRTFASDRYEIFAWAAESHSFALGAQSAGGVIGRNVNLNAPPFNFGNEHKFHSGQFRGMNMERRHYWEQLLIDCGLKETE